MKAGKICEHVAEKYGSTKEQSDASRVRMTKAGPQVGFEVPNSDVMRMHNTLNPNPGIQGVPAVVL